MVLENGLALFYSNRFIITDRTIVANEPGIVLVDRSQFWLVLVDIAVPHDDNFVKAEMNKLIKYLGLAPKITFMWDGKFMTIAPIVIGKRSHSKEPQPTSQEVLAEYFG